MGESRLGLSTANTKTEGIMQALYVVPLLAAVASAAPQLLVGGHAPLVHGVAAPAVVAHPVAHAVAHPTVALAHPVAHAVAHPVAHAVAHPAVSIAHPATTLIG